jgi:hypothetical protein
MPGDYSRKLFHRTNRYSGVLMQQGRVQLDADWNEQLDIQLYRTETEAADVIGASGVPKKDDGFRLAVTANGDDLTIAPGRIYVDGLLCELFVPATYTTQPFLPSPPFTTATGNGNPPTRQLALPDGSYLVFLDVCLREVTAGERAHRLIREVALGGPDTSIRLQTVFQVKLLPLGIGSPPSPLASPLSSPLSCTSTLPQFDAVTALTTGRLNARTVPPPDEDNPCLLPPSAGYSRLENQLYRVEVHTGGDLTETTFKWSRNNASVESTIEKIDGNIVTVSEIRKDEVLGFSGLQWVEIVDDESSLTQAPHALRQIEKITPSTREITLTSSAAALAGRPGLRLRGWDQSTPDASSVGLSAASPGGWIRLEGGIEVEFLPGQYHAGDYWLIPARTITAEIEWPPYQIPNTSPEPQPPRGVRHHYARLALLDVFGGVMSVKDCRETFPALTEICAEDICYDNSNCQMPGAETVQDALDRLCAERDLRFHKKHLHGWGIVCGLQVQCGPDLSGQPRRHVTVKKGYAIDCEGNDVILKAHDKIDVISLALASGLLSPGSPPRSPISSPPMLRDGDVCLVLRSNGHNGARYSLEAYPEDRKGLQEVLRDTLLMDVLENCIKSLIDFFTKEFTPEPGEENLPVGPTAKRLTTLLNLVVQLFNPENGSFVFLSGSRNAEVKNSEHTILRLFYERLRERLGSRTFCAMFENARPFPDYPYADPNIHTIFSTGFKTRFRVSPDGVTGYAVGAGNTINVFNLATNEMVAKVEFPAASSATVQDVAFSANGNELYAVATLDNRDTLFAVADVRDLTVTFRDPTMICDAVLVTLGTSPAISANVYAIGRGQGLYEINPQNVVATPPLLYAFPAAGHLILHGPSKNAFATAGAGATPTTYDRVLRLNLQTATPETQPAFAVAARDASGGVFFTSGQDDIALTSQSAPALYIVALLDSAAGSKQVAVYSNPLTGNGSIQPSTFVDLGENTGIRLAHNPSTNHMMVVYEDSYRVGLINVDHTRINFRHPVQISPVWLEVSPGRGMVYVVNFGSNTITASLATHFQPSQQLPLQDLVDYRAGVINAFADLLAGLLQYLKDCFCDHLLVDCPTCDEEDKLYLACITIKNGQVFKICNFSLRKYVHSFPTWEYWLSLVPILPLIRFAIEKLCCAALPSLFGRFNAPRPRNAPDVVTTGTNFISGGQLRDGVGFARNTDFQGMFREQTARLRTGGGLLARTFFEQPDPAPTPATLVHSDVVNRPADEATRRLEAINVRVQKVEIFDPIDGSAHLARFVAAPGRLRQDTDVVLVTDTSGKVLYYKRADVAGPEIAALRTDLDTVRADVAAVSTARPELDELRTRLDANSTALTATQASVEEALRLRAEVVTLKTELAQVLKTSAESRAAAEREIAELRVGSRDLVTRFGEMQAKLDSLSVTPPPRRTGKTRGRKPPEK